ncbi:hypothetical protein BKA64DRAFT_639116 [Cadophora sp. MPI-SDFR-AT-0126]|nr:hypothetical protein BKA64DRAFT_639116 [Leotiomycetes sp. MPI-SDFR-AT-0126]
MATDTSTTNIPANASDAIEAPKQSFEQFFTFDGGDVEITVTIQGEQIKGKVASQVMALASPVWKKFIFPPWTTDSGSQVKTIDFSDDDACALLILLRTAHGRFKMIPKVLSLETLYQVAIQTEKYDCVELVLPFLDQWLSATNYAAPKDHNGKWLYICWAFGREAPFKYVAEKMTKSVKVVGGECFTSTGDRLSEPLPDKIIENITNIRAGTMQKILDIIYAEVKRYGDLNCANSMLCKSGSKSCDVIVYGSILIGLQQIGLWPPIAASEMGHSINDITRMIRELKIQPRPQTKGKNGSLHLHFDCSIFPLCRPMDKVLWEMPTPGLDCHIIHMENRRGLSKFEGDPLMDYTPCVRCSQVHSAMIACAANEKKSSDPTE